MQAELTETNRQNFLPKLFLRFFAAYFFIYIFPFPLYYIPLVNIISGWYQYATHALILWTAKHILHISLPKGLRSDVSDQAYDYVKLLVSTVLAALIAILWSVIDKIKKYNEQIIYWITVYIRYRFALSMLKYGFEKIQKVQFPFPYNSLTETYGESSPMRLLWNFMGYSTPYNIFIGILETGAGYLLLFRKTKLLGALLSIVVLSNVVMLNFCYDVPVKLHSVTLLFMAVFIAAPDTRRLTDFFIRNKTVLAIENLPMYNKQWMKLSFSTLSFFVIVFTLYIKAGPVWRQYTSHDNAGSEKIPLYGIYMVEQFVRNHDTISAAGTDARQWKMISILRSKQATIKMANDNLRSYYFYANTLRRSIQLYENRDSGHHQVTLFYEIPDSVHLVIRGKLKEDSVNIVMRKQDMNRYELLNRGFHWISEFPYNK